MSDVRRWLARLGLEEYADVFERERVTVSNLPELTDADLKELGLPLGPRKTVLAAIKKLGASELSISAQSESTIAASAGPTEAQAERRQLTVMFCDLVGSTELSQKLDPEALRELMRNYQHACGQVIEKYDGHVAQYLGDGLMVYFGWPRAHEDDVERAIRSGLELVQATKEVRAPEALRVRIGVATGPVVVGETGDGDASVPKIAVGETPNLAARLQGLAGADEIILSPTTHRLASGAFEYADLGSHTLKGIVQPVRAWRVIGEGKAGGRFEATHSEQMTPLVGRDLELGLLMDRWARAQEGEGQVVLLSGEPGIGKSRILNALRERLDGETYILLSSQASPFYANTAFYPIADQMARMAGFERHDSADAKLDKLEDRLARLEFNLSEVMPLFAAALSIPVGERYPPLDMSPQKQKDRIIAALAEQVVKTSRDQPVLFVVEDLHWCDPTSIEVLGAVIDAVRDARVLVVCTFRPEFKPPWTGETQVTPLTLNRLDADQSEQVATRVAGTKRLPEEIIEQIVRKTDGVPLFVEELTKAILETDIVSEQTDHYILTAPLTTLAIPATLHDSLMARLDRLAPTKEAAQIGACIGREFSRELLALVSTQTKDQLDHAIEQLLASELVFQRSDTDTAVYTFKHALVQDAAYESLLKSKRAEIHARIARVLEEHFPQSKNTEPELLAHHLTAAGEFETAIPLWQKAGEVALKRMALSESIAHLNHGLELVLALPHSRDRDDSELALRTALGTAWLALKGWPAPEVWSSLHPALALAKSLRRNDALLPILFGMAQNVLTQGRAAEALPWSVEMLNVAKAARDADMLIAGQMCSISCNFWLGQLTNVQEQCKEVSAHYAEEEHYQLVDVSNHDPKTLVGVMSSIATWMQGYPDRAVRISDEKDAHARSRGHPFDLGWALTVGADIFDFRCEPEELRKRAEECEQLGRDNSMPVLWALLAPVGYGVALIREGKSDEGMAMLEAGLAVWDSVGGKCRSPYLKSVLAEAKALNGDVDGALELVDKQIDQVERPGWEERLHYAEILRLKGWMLTLKNDLDGAEESYLASLAWAREQKAKSWELRTATSLAHLWQQQGKHKRANDLLEPVYSWFTEGFDTKDLKDAKALLEELEVATA